MISASQKETVYNIPKPQSIMQMSAFIGAEGYSQQWISGFPEIAKPLQDYSQLNTVEPLQWTPEVEEAFTRIK